MRNTDLPTPPDPVRIKGATKRFVRIPRGEVQVRRSRMGGAVTVIARCE